MPTRYTTQPRWRQRRQAINRKGWDPELVFDADEEGIAAKPVEPQDSPTTVASVFPYHEMMPELKPMMLPGSWMVVGKKGRIIRPSIMYDEPCENSKQKKLKAKQKKRRAARRSREVEDEEVAFVDIVEEAQSTSKCRMLHEHAIQQHAKQASHGLSIKRWAHYRREKELKILARDALVITLVTEDACNDEPDTEKALAPLRATTAMRARDNKANTRRAKARRKARMASAASRCYWPDNQDEQMSTSASAMASSPSTRVSASAKHDAQARDVEEAAAMPSRASIGKKGLVGMAKQQAANCSIA